MNDDKEKIREEKKGKKRVRKSLTWKTKVAKTQRNSGKAYKSLSTLKKQILERKLHRPCGPKYRLSCRNNFDGPSRQRLFNAFLGTSGSSKAEIIYCKTFSRNQTKV